MDEEKNEMNETPQNEAKHEEKAEEKPKDQKISPMVLITVIVVCVGALFLFAILSRVGVKTAGDIAVREEVAPRGETMTAEDVSNRAVKLSLSGDIEGSVREFEKAIEMAPEKVGIRYNLAQTYLRMGDREAAINELKEALIIQPDFTIARDTLVAMGVPREEFAPETAAVPETAKGIQGAEPEEILAEEEVEEITVEETQEPVTDTGTAG